MIAGTKLRTLASRRRAVTEPDALTPIDWHDGIGYKRDDLFMPFFDIDLNGGKVRQAMTLVEANLDTIRNDYGSTLVTATGVHSPQGLIIARVAKHYGLACRIFIGVSTPASVRRHRMLVQSAALGAEIDTTSRIAYESGLATTIKSWRAAHDGIGFPIRLGMNVDSDPAAVLGTTSSQCANIPEHVTTVVVPVGAGVTAAGVILGVRDGVRVVCVQIAGIERRPAIDRMANGRPYAWRVSNDHAYSYMLRRHIAPGLVLDPVYEAKAHEYMSERLDVPNGRTLFWIVGDSRFVR